MNRKHLRKIGLAVALAALGVTAIIIHRPVTTPPLPDLYFFDLETNTLYAQPPGTHAPTQAPSGGMGVMAAVFSCGSCDDPASRFIGYLVMHSPQYTQALKDGAPITRELSETGILFRSVDDDKWFTRESEMGRALIEGVQRRCPEEKLRACSP